MYSTAKLKSTVSSGLAVALLATTPTLSSCWLGDDTRHIGWERERLDIGPIELKCRVAYVDSARDRVIVISVGEDYPRISTYAIGRRAIFATPTPDREHLAVITRGEEALVKGQVDQEPHLWIIDTTGADTVPVSYPIGSPFDRLAIAEDGSVAVAYFSGAGPDSEGFFRNPNELAVVDLAREAGDDNPTLKTIRSFGSVPDGIILSPLMSIPGAEDPTPRIFAFILAVNNLTILDATYPERNEVSIRLDIADTTVRPREMVFAPNTATAYLRSDNARDVLEILINYEPPSAEDPNDNDYRPALAELGAGGGPADIAVYDDAEGQRFVLAVTPNTREVVIIDADTAQFSTVATPDPIDRVILFPNDPDVVPRVALLASIGSRLPRVHLLSLDGITDELVQADLTTIDLDQPVLDVVPVPGRELGMIVHDDDRTVLGLLDVAFGSVSPLQGVGRLDSYDFSPDGKYLIGASLNVNRVGFLELANLHPSDMRLDDEPERVFALSNGAIFVDHGDPFGRATIIPEPGAKRSESMVLTGFLLTDLIDEGF
jgi:hypothetical protein